MNDIDRRVEPWVWLSIVAFCHAGVGIAAADTLPAEKETSSPIVGNSTSHAWPDMPIAGSEARKDMVDRMNAGDYDVRQMVTSFVQEPPEGRRRGERRGPGQERRGGARRGGSDGAPKTGEEAPGFTLKVLDSEKKVSLATFRGKRPVILFFGSYT